MRACACATVCFATYVSLVISIPLHESFFFKTYFFLFTFAFAFSTFFLSRRLATFHDTGLAFLYVQTHFFYPHYFDFT